MGNRKAIRAAKSTKADRTERAIARRKAQLRAAHVRKFGALPGGEMIRPIRGRRRRG